MSRPDASLFVVATPIGNLQDITLRALEVLGEVDTVVSEHVRKTRNLLDHFGIKARVLSYREENAARMGAVIVEMLRHGKSVALVAEAGTPGVSDPGRLLVRAAREHGFRVVPIPGASALAAAISIAGLDEQRFVFEGFLPRRAAKRRQRLGELAADQRATILFEAPHRLVECLDDLAGTFGDRPCIVCRELTKLHEEVERGTVSGFAARFAAQPPVGEFVIILEGAGGAEAGSGAPQGVSFEEAVREARGLVAGGQRKKDAAKLVEKRHRLRPGTVYRALSRARERGDS